MRHVWRRIRTHWNITDTLVFGSCGAATGIFIGNCWWESVWVTYATLGVILLLQLSRAVRAGGALRDALVFGGIVAWLWPFGEYVVVHTFGWWGAYLAPGPRILDTAVYCILVGWLATAYCYYLSRRICEMGYSPAVSAFHTGLTAFVLGVVGENLFVGARMWVYDASNWDWWRVPAFVPVAYGLGYAVIPLVRRFHMAVAVLIFGLTLSAASIVLGIIAGFFPRP